MLECGSNHLATEQKETFRGIGMSINQKVGQQSLQNSPKRAILAIWHIDIQKNLDIPVKLVQKFQTIFTLHGYSTLFQSLLILQLNGKPLLNANNGTTFELKYFINKKNTHSNESFCYR